MTISIVADNLVIPVKHISFSDGATNLQLDIPADFKPKRTVFITVEPTTPVNSYLMEIALARHAITLAWDNGLTKPEYKLALNLLYLPHGRADRVFQLGNPLPLWTFFDIIKDWFAEIIITDPHSDYLQRTFPSQNWMITVYPQHQCAIETIPKIISGDVIVVPDEGAINKATQLRDLLKRRKVETTLAFATKSRNLDNGHIFNVQLENGDYVNKRCIIVDDIADGGGTFIPLAQALRNAGASSVELYVTHGIFAKGLGSFKGLINAIHVYQIIGSYISRADLREFNSTDSPIPQ